MGLMVTIETGLHSMQSRRDFVFFSAKKKRSGGHPPRRPNIGRPSISPEPPDKGGFKLGRRPLIIAGTVVAIGAAAAVTRPWERLISQPEKDSVPNLDLKIDEAEFWKVVKAGGKFEVLPDATDKSKLLPYSPNIYMGRSGTLFKIGINKPLIDFMIGQSKLLNPPLRTNIAFVEDWGEGDMVSGEGGFSGITKDETEQNIIIWLKRAAWHAFKAADKQNLPIQDYYQGFLSLYASSWTVHEFGHAGAETKELWKKGQQIPQAQFEAVNPQIHAFQKQYEGLYDQAGKQGLAADALLVGIEPTINLSRLRAQINQEAKQGGFE